MDPEYCWNSVMLDAAYLSFNNRSALAQSQVAGCYACMSVFKPEQVVRWTYDDTTALCPHCGRDTVLPGIDDPVSLAEARVQVRGDRQRRNEARDDDDDEETRPAVFSPRPE